MLETAPVTLSDGKKSLTGALKWCYWSITAVLPMFGHVGDFDLWNSNLSEMLNNIPKSVFN